MELKVQCKDTLLLLAGLSSWAVVMASSSRDLGSVIQIVFKANKAQIQIYAPKPHAR